MVNNQQIASFLRRFNRWRRGDESIEQPEPKEIGEMIDAACDELERTALIHCDSDGQMVGAGDRIFSSYGIPSLRIEGEIVDRDGVLWVLTPNANPKFCTLSEFKEALGEFWKL